MRYCIQFFLKVHQNGENLEISTSEFAWKSYTFLEALTMTSGSLNTPGRALIGMSAMGSMALPTI